MGYGYINMLSKNLTRETNLTLDIANGVIENRKNPSIILEDFNKTNLSALTQLIFYHELTPFAYIYFSHSSYILPKELMEFFKAWYYFTLFRNAYFQEEFFKLTEVFMREGVTILPIKGLALLGDIYKRESVRTMVDMDILVREEELEKAEGILIKHGYRKDLGKGSESYWKNKNCNIPFKKKERGWPLELHFALDIKRANRDLLPKLWERLRLIDFNKKKIKVLSPEDTLFSLALHQRRFGRRLCLKNTLDVALLINKYNNNFDWDYVLSEAKAGKMCSTIFFALFQANILLNIQIPRYVWKCLKVSFLKKELIRRLIKKDTFSMGCFKKIKYLHLKCHFLVYDSIWEPIRYLLGITQEEFAKFYNLPIYAPETGKLYKARFFYEPYRLFKDKLEKKSF